MRYFIIIIAVLLLSGNINPQSSMVSTVYPNPTVENHTYLSIDHYQDDYILLQRKSINVDKKVKKILDIIKPE